MKDFEQIISDVKEVRNYIDPSAVALTLPDELGLNKSEIKRILREENPIDFVYEGFYTFLDEAIVDSQARVVIWTDDYLDRVSCVVGQYRRNLSHEQRNSLSAASHHQDKLIIFPHVVEAEYLRYGSRNFAIIDDCKDNLARAQKIFQDLSLEDSSLTTLCTDFHIGNGEESEVENVMKNMRIDTWLVDFNDVIINKTKYEASCVSKAETLFTRKQSNDF